MKIVLVVLVLGRKLSEYGDDNQDESSPAPLPPAIFIGEGELVFAHAHFYYELPFINVPHAHNWCSTGNENEIFSSLKLRKKTPAAKFILSQAGDPNTQIHQ